MEKEQTGVAVTSEQCKTLCEYIYGHKLEVVGKDRTTCAANTDLHLPLGSHDRQWVTFTDQTR